MSVCSAHVVGLTRKPHSIGWSSASRFCRRTGTTMTTDQLLRIIPLTGMCVTLICFAAARLVRAHRAHDVERWPLSWDCLSALFLASLGLVSGVSAVRIVLDYPESAERWASYTALWTAFVVSLWTLGRWVRDGRTGR